MPRSFVIFILFSLKKLRTPIQQLNLAPKQPSSLHNQIHSLLPLQINQIEFHSINKPI